MAGTKQKAVQIALRYLIAQLPLISIFINSHDCREMVLAGVMEIATGLMANVNQKVRNP